MTGKKASHVPYIPVHALDQSSTPSLDQFECSLELMQDEDWQTSCA
jgi:hypothetical protein